MAETPIEVNPSQLPGSLGTLLRYGLTALGGLLLSKNILPAGTDVNQIVGALLMIISTGYGLFKTVSNKSKLVTAAAAAPNHVAVVKG